MLNLKHLRFSLTSIACRVTNSVSGAGMAALVEQGREQAENPNGRVTCLSIEAETDRPLRQLERSERCVQSQQAERGL